MNGTVVLAALALVVVVAAWLLSRPRRNVLGGSARDRLIHLCLGDKRQVRRLVALEKRRSPGISRSEAEIRALESIQRDNT